MAATRISEQGRSMDPVHAVLLASVFPLFLGALLSDWAYFETYEVQWTNFASWLIAGGLVFAGLALIWAVFKALRGPRGHRKAELIGAGFLAATFGLGFVNALVHAKDAWAAMPGGFILSLIVLVFALTAIWTGFAGRRPRRSP